MGDWSFRVTWLDSAWDESVSGFLCKIDFGAKGVWGWQGLARAGSSSAVHPSPLRFDATSGPESTRFWVKWVRFGNRFFRFHAASSLFAGNLREPEMGSFGNFYF